MEVVKTSSKANNFVGRVRVGDGKVAISPLDDPDKVYKFSKADVPNFVKKGTFHVSLSDDGSEIYGMRPAEGTFRGKFKNFFSKNGDVPKPFLKESKTITKGIQTFTTKEHREFSPNFVLTQEGYEGMPVTAYLWYDYLKENKKGYVKVEGSGTKYDQLVAFLDAHGLLEADIEYEDNLLPRLYKLLKKANREIMISIKGGWAVGFSEIPESLDDDDDDLLDGDDFPEPDEDDDDGLSGDDDDDDIPF